MGESGSFNRANDSGPSVFTLTKEANAVGNFPIEFITKEANAVGSSPIATTKEANAVGVLTSLITVKAVNTVGFSVSPLSIFRRRVFYF